MIQEGAIIHAYTSEVTKKLDEDLCKQIKELMELMSFEETKLELAKFAWHHNLDKGNYYQLNDAFGFESSIEELNKYTQSH